MIVLLGWFMPWVELFVYGGPRSHFFAQNLLANKIIFTCILIHQNCFIQYVNFHHLIEKQKLIQLSKCHKMARSYSV